MINKTIPVCDKHGNVLGHVSQSATSVGAAKIAGSACEYSLRFGFHAWVRKGSLT